MKNESLRSFTWDMFGYRVFEENEKKEGKFFFFFKLRTIEYL